MEPIHLFDLAAKQAQWLSVSQSVIAANVSNANTPQYKAQTVQPFADVMARTQLELASTNPAHFDLSQADRQSVAVKTDQPWETTDSGNSVSVEQEMMKASEVNRNFSLNTNLVRAFHGMLMQSVKG